MSAAEERELFAPADLVGPSRMSLRNLAARMLGPFPSYEEARAEAHTACRQLGLLFGRPVDNLDSPKSVLERNPGESDHQHAVRAVQQVVAYGLAKR